MCNERDMTKLEAYILTRPKYADDRRQAYADWALDDDYDINFIDL